MSRAAGAPRVRVERDGAVLVLTLDRAAKRNALDDRTVAELRAALRDAEGDASLRVILLRGEGPDFCAGADLAQLERIAEEADPVANMRDAEGLGRLLIEMRRHPLPIIAAVHGHAWAGGAGLATACDVVLATPDASFAYPEIRLGFVPAMVMTLLRRAVGEKIAFELVTAGESIDAGRAAELGIATRVLHAEDFDDAARAYARTLAERSASAVALTKRLLYGMDGLSFEESILRGAEVNAMARMTPDTRAGVRAFLEKGKAKAEGRASARRPGKPKGAEKGPRA